jgi:magnesium transporter
MYIAAAREGKSRSEASADLRIARGWLEQPAERTWIDLESPTADELKFLQARFDLHPLAVEECDHTGVRPKIEEFPGHVYLVLHGMNHNPGASHLDTVEFKFFLMRSCLITIHSHPSSSIRATQERLKRDPGFLTEGPDNVLHHIIDAVIDHYFPVLEGLEDQAQVLEVEVLQRPDQALLEGVLQLRKESQKLQRLIQPQLDILGALASERFTQIDASEAAYFRDVYDHLLRIHDRLQSLRETLTGVMECYLSVQSNQTNQVMKTLTVAAALVLPASFFTSLFGMNLGHLPGREHPATFWWIAGLSILASAGAFLALRSRRWL